MNLKQTKHLLKGNTGFTLMELLIVIVIMGFLLGMLVPRLASVVSGDAVDTVCDSNNKGVRYYTKMYLDQKGRFPADMTNLVNEIGEGTYSLPLIEDKDTDNGPETFALDFYTRNNPRLYSLTDAEATELVSMGISYVRNLNDADGSGHEANQPAGTVSVTDPQTAQSMYGRPNEQIQVEAGLHVAMVGDITRSPAEWDAEEADYPAGNPDFYGRIMLGVGKDCALVKDGYIQAAALCPGGIQNADNVTYNNYVLILPRLQATVDAMDAAIADTEFTVRDAADGSNTAAQMSFTVSAQEAWEFDFTCPEGHKWPDNDNDTWVIQE